MFAIGLVSLVVIYKTLLNLYHPSILPEYLARFQMSPSQGFRKVFCSQHATVSVRKLSFLEIVLVFEFSFKSSDKMISVLGVSSSNLRLFSDIVCVAKVCHGCAIPMLAMLSGDGEPTPDVSLEVRLCSPLLLVTHFL